MKQTNTLKLILTFSFMFVFFSIPTKGGNATYIDYGSIQCQIKIFKYLDYLISKKPALADYVSSLSGISEADELNNKEIHNKIKAEFAEWINYEYHLLKIIEFYCSSRQGFVTYSAEYDKSKPLFRLKLLFLKANKYLDNFPVKECKDYYSLISKHKGGAVLLSDKQIETALKKSKLVFSYLYHIYVEVLKDAYYTKLSANYNYEKPNTTEKITAAVIGTCFAPAMGILYGIAAGVDLIIPDKLINTKPLEKDICDAYFQLSHWVSDVGDSRGCVEHGKGLRVNFSK